MTVRPKLPKPKRLEIGDRVQLSEDGREHYPVLAKNGVSGTVVGYSTKLVNVVRIKLDSTPAPRRFHERDWERDLKPENMSAKSGGGE